MKKTDMSKGVKFDDNKARFDLIPVYPQHEVAKVYTMGARKYQDNNWRKGLRWGRAFAAMLRHLFAFWGGETRDPESGLHHLAHVVFGCYSIMEFEFTHPEFDDRPVKGVEFCGKTQSKSKRRPSRS